MNACKSSQKILEIISGDSNVTTAEIASMLGITRRTVAKHIASLQSFNCLRRIGSDNGGYWEVM